MYSSLSYSSCSGQPECLLGTTSKWCRFTCTHDSSLLVSNISCPQRLYPSSHDPPSGCLSPLPNFFNHAPHTWPTFTHKPATWLQTQGTQPFMQTLCNARTLCVTLVPPPCHASTPLHNVHAMFM